MQYSLYALVQVVEKGNFFFLVFSFSFQPAISAPLQTIPSTIQGTKFFSISSISWMVVLTAHCNLCLCPFSFEYNTIDTHSSQICFHYSLFFFFKYCAYHVISMSSTEHGLFCTAKKCFGNPNGTDNQKQYPFALKIVSFSPLFTLFLLPKHS